jgi:cyclopropane-fatty-acyl-phospholipid synthase
MCKLDHIIRKAKIQEGHRVLEIGSGWGSLAIRIAQRIPGTTIDTITLSSQQQDLAQERIAAEGLGDRVVVHLMDYRSMPPEWESAFDRVVSIEMLESVGQEYFDTYWKIVDWSLKPRTGAGVVQVITIPEASAYNSPSRSAPKRPCPHDDYRQDGTVTGARLTLYENGWVSSSSKGISTRLSQSRPPTCHCWFLGLEIRVRPFIPPFKASGEANRLPTITLLVFPGGILPTLSLLIDTLRSGSKGRLVVDSVSNIGPHYARTLREWRRRFLDRFEDVIVPALKAEHPSVMSDACGAQGRKEIEVFKRKWTCEFFFMGTLSLQINLFCRRLLLLL